MIAREGVDNVVDLAAIGTEKTVARQLRCYLDAGATDGVINPLERDSVDREALWRLAAGLRGAER
ncbi:MAG TPA: hypothetical protein VGG53_18835 [Mycobacterium sp.]|uniref:hypothetical protein n=1 Tax=Mycobacterium sp. TaxID=1785 RepID=UPI002F3F871A